MRLPVSQDNSIVMVDGEWEANAGASGRIRVKGNQHVVAMGFDVRPIRGRRVERAELVCQADAETISGVTISTIAAPWAEMKSNGLTAGIEGVDGWGYRGARFPAVVGGNAYTLVHHSAANLREGVYHWDVSADMIHALATGIGFGLAIHEHDADYRRNPSIFSREQSGKQPYLVVELADDEDGVPWPPADLRLVPVDGASAQLELRAPAEGFAYHITVDGHPLARHNIPLVRPGLQQTIPLRDLPGEVMRPGTHVVEVATINRTGQRSVAAAVRGELVRV